MRCNAKCLPALPIIFTLIVFFSVSSAVYSKPIPSGPKAKTSKEFEQVIQKWRHRSIIEAYHKFGNHTRTWDKDAAKFLDVYYRWHANVGNGALTRQVLAAGNSLIGKGCDDAVALSCYGAALCQAGKPREAVPILQRALNSYAKSRYPKARECLAISQLVQAKMAARNLSSKDYNLLIDRAVACVGKSMTDGSFIPGEQRVMVNAFYLSSPGVYAGARSRYRSGLMKLRKVDPYLLNSVSGYVELDEAWAARGDGMGFTVGEKQWKGFFDHLAKARKALTAAWKLHPEFPEPASAMIPVAMGEPGSSIREVRLWFDRAVAAEMDYKDAYFRLQWALRPRWGGSREDLYSLAVDCLNTRRFDTEVPWFFMQTMCTIEQESRGSKACWDRPDTKKKLRMLFDGYEKSNFGKGTDWFRSVEAALAWHCGRPKDAKAMIARLGNKFQKNAFVQVFGVPYEQARESMK
jgi:tetratricopeptide (TPR) repeat protein